MKILPDVSRLMLIGKRLGPAVTWAGTLRGGREIRLVSSPHNDAFLDVVVYAGADVELDAAELDALGKLAEASDAAQRIAVVRIDGRAS